MRVSRSSEWQVKLDARKTEISQVVTLVRREPLHPEGEREPDQRRPVNEEIRSRVTYSVVLPRLSPEAIEGFILGQLDRAGLGHNTFTQEALALIVRSGEGLLRRTRNLCLSALTRNGA